MRICLVTGGQLAEVLRQAGHEVLTPNPAGGIRSVARLLPEGFAPDLFVQVEGLGARILLEGLEEVPCPTVFWSVDGHLNFAWQRHYARLFDCVATTQPHLEAPFRAAGCRADWLPWFAPALPFAPHADRPREVGFVGRVTPQRLAREWMVAFLRRHHGGEHAENLAFSAMLAFYQATRIAPNETIGGEINFRLFETAGAGCLVLTPPGPRLEELLAPGRECEVFGHVLELDALLSFYRTHPSAAERLGRAAWEAVQARHLARHRAERLLGLGASAEGRCRGLAARAQLALAAANLWRSGGLVAEPDDILGLLSVQAGCPAVSAAVLRLLVESGRAGAARTLLRDQLAHPAFSQDTELALTASLAALRLGDFPLAGRVHAAWARQARVEACPAASPAELCLAWARGLGQERETLTLGFGFDPSRHLPLTASQCLLVAQALAPDDPLPVRRLASQLANRPGGETLRLGLLSRLTMWSPGDWRLGLELGLSNLAVFRLEAGLEELALARTRAERAGQAEAFLNRLRRRDPGGSACRALSLEAPDEGGTSRRNPL